MANLERIYTIPLGAMYEIVRQKRGKRAVKFMKEFALRHMKASAVKMSEGTNSLVLRDGIQKPPRRIKVRIVKDDKNTAKIWLIGEEEKLKEIADKRKKEEEAAKKEQEKKAEEQRKKEDAKKKEEAARKEEKKADTAAQAPKPAAAAAQKQPAPLAQNAPAKK